MRKNNNNTTTASSSVSSTPAGTPRSSRPPQVSSLNRLLPLFRTFPSWSSTVGSTTITAATTEPMSLWSRLKFPSQSALSQRENNNLRKLREEANRKKTTTLQSLVSSSSLATSAAGGTSSLDLTEMMNTGGGIFIPSLRQAPINQRVYVVEEV